MDSVRYVKTFTESQKTKEAVTLLNVWLIQLLLKMEHVLNAQNGQDHWKLKLEWNATQMIVDQTENYL